MNLPLHVGLLVQALLPSQTILPLPVETVYPALQLTVNPLPVGEFTEGLILFELDIVNGVLQVFALHVGLLVQTPVEEHSMVPLEAEAVYPVAQFTLNE